MIALMVTMALCNLVTLVKPDHSWSQVVTMGLVQFGSVDQLFNFEGQQQKGHSDDLQICDGFVASKKVQSLAHTHILTKKDKAIVECIQYFRGSTPIKKWHIRLSYSLWTLENNIFPYPRRCEKEGRLCDLANSCLLSVPLGARESAEREKEREREQNREDA